MAEQLVADEPEPRKPVVFIKRKEHRRRLGISRVTEYRLLQRDPDHPKPILPFGYIEAESDAYARLLIARARGEANGEPAPELPEPPPEPAKPSADPREGFPRPGICRDWGAPIVRSGARGRPPVRCGACRHSIALRYAGSN